MRGRPREHKISTLPPLASEADKKPESPGDTVLATIKYYCARLSREDALKVLLAAVQHQKRRQPDKETARV
jgi:hypothetical protein